MIAELQNIELIDYCQFSFLLLGLIAVKGLGEVRQEQGGRAPPVQEAPAKGGGLHLASNSSRENAAAFAAR